uniref:Uncharacterized protein n=1 Tax=Candidatus Kentrum sp. DK TaxID=2126562 RepID=A0A450RVD5_9GAMM|nr:MAG: hypothetical protein BECKDK2373B_GA0170837_100428 [Candidatus Kentron sp. DK]
MSEETIVRARINEYIEKKAITCSPTGTAVILTALSLMALPGPNREEPPGRRRSQGALNIPGSERLPRNSSFLILNYFRGFF